MDDHQPVTDDLSSTGARKEEQTASLTTQPWLKRFVATPPSLLKSRIGWRIILTFFATILLIQGAALYITVHHFDSEKMNTTRITAGVFLSALFSEIPDGELPKWADVKSTPLSSDASIAGMVIYDENLHVIESFGMAPNLIPKANNRGVEQKRIPETSAFSATYAPPDIGRPYHVVLRIYSTSLTPLLSDHMMQAILILLGISLGVTGVLMYAIGKWVLEPVMILRTNLLNAARNPEMPDIQRLKVESRDEIGIALKIANDLIRQNAHNLKRLRAQAEDKIHRLAYYDALTGLPNRTFFMEKLDDTIKRRVIDDDIRLSVICVDIDHFKDINDTMGHEFGDKLLEAISKRMVKALPTDVIISRASADEFIIMTILKGDHSDSAAIVDSIFDVMAKPISIMQEEFLVRVSIGVAHCPDDGMDAHQILKNADIALNRAKEEGRDTVRYYSEDFDLVVQQRFKMLRDLRTALDENQLQLYYQPQFDLTTGLIVGAEALLRWFRPDNSREGGTFISPAEFIPAAEQSGLIVPIGEWVLREAARQNKEWQDQGLPAFRMAVNISSVQFHRADIVALVADVLRETGLKPHFLELEVTESVFMENMQTTIDILNQLNRQGVEIAIDDFGTGYSSLSYLRQFPIDRLKIDQSFIRNALVNPDDRVIARTIINLGHSLNLRVMAEGVETLEHENFLRADGCDDVQGFKYSKPIPAAQFVEYVRDYYKTLSPESKLSIVEDHSA